MNALLNEIYNIENPILQESLYDAYNALYEGIHFGDKGVGSDTYLGRMHAGNGGRGTGHFGTGVYFLSDNNDNTYLKKTRPGNIIDHSKYKLLKVSNKQEADNLHNGLKILNSVVDSYLQGNDNQFDLIDKALSLISKVDPRANYYSPNQLNQLAEEKANIFNRDGISSKESTLSTDFVKMLGYNGIDVTDVPEYDNSMYGSVLYKL